MTTFGWTSELILGNAAMDDDHQQLIDALNKIVDAIAVDPGAEAVFDGLTGLAGRVQIHFATEEVFMEEIGFPSRVTHSQAHASLLIQLKVLTDVIADGTMEADHYTLDFLASWLIDHISGLDRDLADFASARTHTQKLQRAVNS